jgi:uncharacterized protein YbjQ (UPF0145 family)
MPPGAAPRPPGRDLEDQEALGRGDLPVSVQERLTRERDRDLPWTSTLSVADWAVGRGLGFTPLGQVMGSSIYHTGWTYMSGWQSGELEAPTRAAHSVRTLALERMRQEAALLGASGVIAVAIKRKTYAWGDHLTEFTATGTAVRIEGARPAARPFLATVDGTDLRRLILAGHVPVGVALGVSVAYIYTDWGSQMQEMGWFNQEMVSFTQATYEVRRLAMDRLERGARADGADGVVAYDTAMEVTAVEGQGGGQNERTDHIIEFSAMGTEIGRMAGAPAASGAVSILSLRDRNQEGS